MAVIHGDERRVLVIGAGVSGLTSALCLLRSGFKVTVVAEKVAPNITSVVAEALWEWPPSACGYHHDQKLLARTKAWCMTSYQMFSQLAGAPEAGVFMRKAVFTSRLRWKTIRFSFRK